MAKNKGVDKLFVSVISLTTFTIFVNHVDCLIYKNYVMDDVSTKPSPPVDVGPLVLYNDRQEACAFMEIEGKFDLSFETKTGTQSQVVVDIPSQVSVTGLCEPHYVAKYMIVGWSSFTLSFYFGVDDEDDYWFLRTVTVTYNMSDPVFSGKAAGARMELDTPLSFQPILKARLDRAFYCLNFGEIPLQNKYREQVGMMIIRNIKVQPFAGEGAFAEMQTCLRSRHPYDEMVPIAIGSTLAILTLLVIAGYAIFRYFKVKKVGYDTME